MSRRPQAFKLADVTKALKAAEKAGLDVSRFEIDREGKIVVFAGAPASAPDTNTETSTDIRKLL